MEVTAVKVCHTGELGNGVFLIDSLDESVLVHCGFQNVQASLEDVEGLAQ